jgi:hypothetical protein
VITYHDAGLEMFLREKGQSINAAHLFKINSKDFAGEDGKLTDALKTFDDMVRLGIAKLPYDPCAIQIVDGWNYTFLVKGTIPNGLHFRLKDGDGQFIDKEKMSDPTGATMPMPRAAYYFVALLIVALATRGVQKRVTQNKRAGLGIGKKHNREYRTITYIRAPIIGVRGDRRNGVPSREVRAHFRRGHVRMQHYGPGNAQVKQIWIEPCFVNGDGEYVERDFYQVSGAKNTEAATTQPQTMR